MAQNSQDFNTLEEDDMVCVGDYMAKWKDVRNVLLEFEMEITYENVYDLMVSTIEVAKEEKAKVKEKP